MGAKIKPQIEDLSIAIQQPGQDVVTARIAGELRDLRLCVSPRREKPSVALRNMAKAINVALQGDFLETRLEPVYDAARVHRGTVEILHRDYIGLGDGFMASIGKVARSFVLTLKGPDPVAPAAKEDDYKGGPVTGLMNLLARKLDLVQEFEDMVPSFVAQMLDRLESVQMIVDWYREEWEITTKRIGLDAVLRPVLEGESAALAPKKRLRGKKKSSSSRRR